MPTSSASPSAPNDAIDDGMRGLRYLLVVDDVVVFSELLAALRPADLGDIGWQPVHMAVPGAPTPCPCGRVHADANDMHVVICVGPTAATWVLASQALTVQLLDAVSPRTHDRVIVRCAAKTPLRTWAPLAVRGLVEPLTRLGLFGFHFDDLYWLFSVHREWLFVERRDPLARAYDFGLDASESRRVEAKFTACFSDTRVLMRTVMQALRPFQGLLGDHEGSWNVDPDEAGFWIACFFATSPDATT